MENLSNFCLNRLYKNELYEMIENDFMDNFWCIIGEQEENISRDCDNHYYRMVHEAFLRSHDHNMFIDKLKELYGNDISVSISNTSSKVKAFEITLEDPSIVDQDLLNRWMNFFNFTLTSKSKNKLTNLYKLSFEPNLTEEVTQDVIKYGYIYHISHKRTKPYILKKGIRVKGGGNEMRYKHVPDRIYFVYGDDIKSKIEKVISDKFYKDDYIIYKIDLNKLPITPIFYKDLVNPDGYIFGYCMIPPRYIEEIKINDID